MKYETVASLFSYDPFTGELVWLVNRYSGLGGTKLQVQAGSIAGWSENDGGRMVQIDGRVYPAANIIWCLQTGEWPKNIIDHINGDRSNNKWLNLRAATFSQNAKNRKPNLNGRSGISWNKKVKKWQARIMVNYKRISLGYFSLLQDAIAARKQAEKIHYGEFRRE